MSPEIESDDDTKKLLVSIRGKIDEFGRKIPLDKVAQTASELVIMNARQLSISFHGLALMLDVDRALKERLKDLEDQEREFWSTNSRPPKYYARTIALRLARLYAREKGARPTVGVSRDGGHPSTEFTRAVERVFEVLEIKAAVRRQAKWAVAQLTDEDLKPAPRNMLGSLFSPAGFGISPTKGNVLADYIGEAGVKGAD